MALKVGKSFIGGARIGNFNATIPFARLIIHQDKVTLSSWKQYNFNSREVKFEPIGRIPLLSCGIQFHHTHADYPWPIIFWCVRRKPILECLETAGFEIQ